MKNTSLHLGLLSTLMSLALMGGVGAAPPIAPAGPAIAPANPVAIGPNGSVVTPGVNGTPTPGVNGAFTQGANSVGTTPTTSGINSGLPSMGNNQSRLNGTTGTTGSINGNVNNGAVGQPSLGNNQSRLNGPAISPANPVPISGANPTMTPPAPATGSTH